MKRIVLGILAIAVMSVASSVSALAGYVGTGGNLNNGTFTSAPTTGAGLLGDITVTDFLTSSSAGNALGDFDGVPLGTNFFSGVYNFTGTIINTTVSFGSLTDPWGLFTGTITTDARSDLGGGAESRTIIVTGDFFTGTAAYYGGSGKKDDGRLILTFSKASTGGSVTSSWALDTVFSNPSAVPEPTSIAIFGIGAVGFAARRFRRK